MARNAAADKIKIKMMLKTTLYSVLRPLTAVPTYSRLNASGSSIPCLFSIFPPIPFLGRLDSIHWSRITADLSASISPGRSGPVPADSLLAADICAKVTAVAADKLKLSAKPDMGKVKVASAVRRISSDIPVSSFPMTTHTGPSSQSSSLTSTEPGLKSLAYILNPFALISATASIAPGWLRSVSHCAEPIATLIPRFCATADGPT
mmetsp:Transcript_27848/g.55786  ORF Transcript_27848/g.55786 Transcript_27848/m.55786 type:complete len:206 (+) Transcript_27848:395-1012(+)